MVRWKYDISSFGEGNIKEIYRILDEAGYKKTRPDGRFRNEDLEFRKTANGRLLHLIISRKQKNTMLNFKLHEDLEKGEIHKALKTGCLLDIEKAYIIREIEKIPF